MHFHSLCSEVPCSRSCQAAGPKGSKARKSATHRFATRDPTAASLPFLLMWQQAHNHAAAQYPAALLLQYSGAPSAWCENQRALLQHYSAPSPADGKAPEEPSSPSCSFPARRVLSQKSKQMWCMQTRRTSVLCLSPHRQYEARQNAVKCMQRHPASSEVTQANKAESIHSLGRTLHLMPQRGKDLTQWCAFLPECATLSYTT